MAIDSFSIDIDIKKIMADNAAREITREGFESTLVRIWKHPTGFEYNTEHVVYKALESVILEKDHYTWLELSDDIANPGNEVFVGFPVHVDHVDGKQVFVRGEVPLPTLGGPTLGGTSMGPPKENHLFMFFALWNGEQYIGSSWYPTWFDGIWV